MGKTKDETKGIPFVGIVRIKFKIYQFIKEDGEEDQKKIKRNE